MPYYAYYCSACAHADEVQQSIHKPLPTHCPKCGKKTWLQDYAAKRPVVNDGVPRSVMQQAEQNAKRDGKELTRLKAEQMLGADEVARREGKIAKPWWRDGDKPLDVTRLKDPQHYVLTGETG